MFEASLTFIIIITQRADCDGACVSICAAGGRRSCRVAATSAATSARDRSRCGDGGHARGGHTMATGVSVQHHHASVRPTLGRKGCNHVVHSGNHVVHDRRGIGDRRALRGPRERFVGVQGWPRGMCDRLLVTCAHVSVVGLGPGARFAVECPFAVLAVVAVTRRAV